MRTTLDLDQDVLEAARALASETRQSVGKVLSDVARRMLLPAAAPRSLHGVPLFPSGPDARPVTLEMVNRLRDE